MVVLPDKGYRPGGPVIIASAPGNKNGRQRSDEAG
jgi:hypothetical protein